MMKADLLFVLTLIVAVWNNAHAFLSPSIRKTDPTLKMTILTYGNKKMDFKPGTPLKAAVAKLGIKPKYSCNK